MSETEVSGSRTLDSFLARPEELRTPPPAADKGGSHVGEVVESSTTELVAEARRLHGAPDFGAFVRIESEAQIVGVVFNARTQSLEPNRRPTAYGKTEDELRREQPQIFELLRTQFEVFVLGYLDGDRLVHLYPAQPARIHSFVYPSDADEVRQLTEDQQFLRSILDATGVPADELVLATLRQALQVRSEVEGSAGDYLVRMGAELSRLLRDDYDRLSSLVRRLTSLR
jgi:hypothetical protein